MIPSLASRLRNVLQLSKVCSGARSARARHGQVLPTVVQWSAGTERGQTGRHCAARLPGRPRGVLPPRTYAGHVRWPLPPLRPLPLPPGPSQDPLDKPFLDLTRSAQAQRRRCPKFLPRVRKKNQNPKKLMPRSRDHDQGTSTNRAKSYSAAAHTMPRRGVYCAVSLAHRSLTSCASQSWSRGLPTHLKQTRTATC